MHATFETAERIEAQGDGLQDRVSIIRVGCEAIIAVADGAGGTGDGVAAAQITQITRLRRFLVTLRRY